MRSLSCCLFLLSSALFAQTAVLRVLMARDALDTSTPAMLIVVEAREDLTLAQGFDALLKQDDLKAFQVPVQTCKLNSSEGQKLEARLRLEAKSQWLLVAQGDQVLAKGTSVPSAAAFAQELLNAGFHDRVKELRAYLKQHPESLEARERLIALLRQRGETAAQRVMGIEVTTPKARLEQGGLSGYLQAADALPQADLSAASSLTPTQDLVAWSAFAQELDEAFRSGAWRELDLPFTREGRPLDAASPTLRNLYQRTQPEVEAALRQDPGSEPLWDLWIWMAQARGGGGLRPLLASLTPSPLTAKGLWPPERAVRMLLATARAPQDWRALQEHFQDRWDGTPQMLRDRLPDLPSSAGGMQTTHAALLEREWASNLEPLLESSLRCGEAARADAILRETLDASHWSALPAKAAAVAHRCGQNALATRWSALRPGGQR
ncbi:MAG TPA: hypothetical protein VJ486_01795 [Geothrix sp.]|nr:hypothetical protein [Geothrix sp.]